MCMMTFMMDSIKYSLNVSMLQAPTAAHIHMGAPGKSLSSDRCHYLSRCLYAADFQSRTDRPTDRSCLKPLPAANLS